MFVRMRLKRGFAWRSRRISKPATIGSPAFRRATSSWLKTRNSPGFTGFREPKPGSGVRAAEKPFGASADALTEKSRPFRRAISALSAFSSEASIERVSMAPSGRPTRHTYVAITHASRGTAARAARAPSPSVHEDPRARLAPLGEEDEEERALRGLVLADAEDVGLAHVHVDRRVQDLAARLLAALAADALEREVAELEALAVARR